MLIFCGRKVSIAGKLGVWVVIRKHRGGIVELAREGIPLLRTAAYREDLLPPRR